MANETLSSITERQTSSEAIDMLAASSRAYGLVKTIAKWQSAIVLSAAVLSGVAIYFPGSKPWVGLYSFVVLLADLVFTEPLLKHYQDLGAKVQEIFDTFVLEIPRNPTKVQSLPEPEVLHSLATKFKKKNATKRLQDWYPSVASTVPIEFGRLICQRANMTWDASLRKAFSIVFFALVFIIIVAAFVAAIATNSDAGTVLLSIVLPLSPMCIKLYREGLKHQDSAAASDRTKTMLHSIWDKALHVNMSSSEMVEAARRLQDEIYDRRRTSPTVPEWLYRLQRNQREAEMNFGSTEMAKTAQVKLNARAVQGLIET